jgi:F0F1-type ATP synthase membrane subunit a
MKRIVPTISLHVISKDEGSYINALVLSHQGNNYHLQGRTTDIIHVFTEALGIYVLTINKGIGHIGLTSYMVPESDPINMVFLHTPLDIVETLGKGWESLKPIVMVQKLIDYLY